MSELTVPVRAGFDVERVRADFPILQQEVHGRPLVYLDSANTSQKPQSVLDALNDYYAHDNANIHRATHLLSERATRAYERSRTRLQQFINAPHMIHRHDDGRRIGHGQEDRRPVGFRELQTMSGRVNSICRIAAAASGSRRWDVSRG